MAKFFKKLLDHLILHPTPPPEASPGGDGLVIESEGLAEREKPPPPEASPGGDGLPRTFRPAAPDDGALRPRLFDPALMHYPSAFRPGDPTFPDEATGHRWAEVRRSVTDHVLRRIVESPWGDRLILRGSRLLRAWAGDQAREPGDLDWVVDPLLLDEPWVDRVITGLVEAVFAGPGPVGVELIRDGEASDDTWTYERAPGQRVVFSWRAPGLPGGAVQVDVVFGETLVEPARRISVPVADGGCVTVRAASPGQSLAWKLLWLGTDMHPQGKDLYDAILLAERFPLPLDVLAETLRMGGANLLPETAAEYVRNWDVDWDNFRAEYPWVGGDANQWLTRLENAIGPTFANLGARDHLGTGSLDPSWLTPTVVEIAAGIASDRAWDRLPILSDALQEAGCDRAELLAHCLARGPHLRGCRVLDLILGEQGDSDPSANSGRTVTP